MHAAAGGELDDEPGLLTQRRDRLAEPAEIERRAVVGAPDVDVDQRRAGGLARLRLGHELLEGRRQLREVSLEVLGPGRGDGDQGAGHAAILPQTSGR